MIEFKQARSQASAARVVTSAERLLAERGILGTGLADILRDARVSVGSFYARFGSQEALVQHVADRFWARARADWQDLLQPSRWTGQPAAAIVDRVVRETLLAHRRHWMALRALVEYGLAHPDARLMKPARDHDGHVIRLVQRLLRLRHHELSHPNPVLAVEIGYLQLTGALRTLILVGWPKTELAAVADDRLAAELARGLRAYLGVRGG